VPHSTCGHTTTATHITSPLPTHQHIMHNSWLMPRGGISAGITLNPLVIHKYTSPNQSQHNIPSVRHMLTRGAQAVSRTTPHPPKEHHPTAQTPHPPHPATSPSPPLTPFAFIHHHLFHHISPHLVGKQKHIQQIMSRPQSHHIITVFIQIINNQHPTPPYTISSASPTNITTTGPSHQSTTHTTSISSPINIQRGGNQNKNLTPSQLIQSH